MRANWVRRHWMSTFVQEAPRHENAFTSDPFLARSLKRLLPQEILASIEPDLVRFGDRVRRDVWQLGQQCGKEEPRLEFTSAWGQNGVKLVTSDAWKKQKEIAAEEGLVAIGYEKDYGAFSRIYQATKLLLYSPASGLYSCPLAMTDGAAQTLLNCDQNEEGVKEALKRLTTRKKEDFWTSGQWMTEKRGGSDVSKATETVAERDKGGFYKLSGYKWFSSATDCDMSLALARTPEGLSLFLVNLAQNRRNIDIVKLKNKLGTRQLPTAELSLHNVEALLVSEPGRGVATIASMLTITRLHNVISSVSIQRKVVQLARDYSQRRMSFGRRIGQHPLHLRTLAQMEVEVRGQTALVLDLARQQGLQDAQEMEANDGSLLRLMMPVAKMFTAKKAVANTSEGIECFGGQGYIEDTPIPAFLRDAQVLPIWEGTTNIMSLDVLRALSKSKGNAMRSFKHKVQISLQNASRSSEPAITAAAQAVKAALLALLDFVSQNQLEPSVMEVSARDFSTSLANIYIGALLIDQALGSQHRLDASVARQWATTRDMCPVDSLQKSNSYRQQRDLPDLVFENYNESDAIEPE